MDITKVSIAIDVDDTIEDLLPAWIDRLNKTHGTEVKYEDITEWDMHKFFPSLTTEQICEPFNDDSFWDEVKPKEGAQFYINKLIEDGYDVYFCTSTYYTNIVSKYEKVIKKYFNIPWSKMIIASEKGLVCTDWMIDDGAHNLEQFKGLKVLFDAPHNKGCKKYKRAMNWKEAYDFITYIENKFIERN